MTMAVMSQLPEKPTISKPDQIYFLDRFLINWTNQLPAFPIAGDSVTFPGIHKYFLLPY